SYTQGATGQATINVTAQAGSAIANAVIGTTGNFNPAAGVYDHSDPDLVLDFTAGACKIGVSLPNGQTSIQLATP
ncbi:hypothetical protein DUT91_25465, partial [Phyllobacterium salinisoli]